MTHSETFHEGLTHSAIRYLVELPLDLALAVDCNHSFLMWSYVCNNVILIVDRQGDRQRLYNLASVGTEREWIRKVLLSSESELSDDDTPACKKRRIKRLLKEKSFNNKYLKDYYKDPGVSETVRILHIISTERVFGSAQNLTKMILIWKYIWNKEINVHYLTLCNIFYYMSDKVTKW